VLQPVEISAFEAISSRSGYASGPYVSLGLSLAVEIRGVARAGGLAAAAAMAIDKALEG